MTEGKENLNPAVLNTDEVPSEMSAEEFRRTLYTWFEDRGLISELRAHLRRQMIDILKDTSLGRTVSTHTGLSPKTQVINLLIAEFLLKHKYHYSLSVFSTEVPFISILPECSTSLVNSSGPSNLGNSNKATKTPSFTEENFWDIIHMLGFARDSEESKKLHESYFRDPDESLLTSMVRLLTNICSIVKIKNKPQFKKTNTRNAVDSSEDLTQEPWLKDIYNLLIHFEVPDDILLQLRDHLKSIFEREQARIKTEESTKFNLLHAQIQKDLQNRETEICRMVNEMENTFYQERQKLTDDLFDEQTQTEQLKKLVLKQQNELVEKLKNIQRREEILKQREAEVAEQAEVLKTRIKVMQNVYDSVIEENLRMSCLRREQNSQTENNNAQEIEESQTRLQMEYEYLRKEIQETKNVIQKFSQSLSDENVSREKSETCEEKLLRGMLERIQAENSRLRVLNTEQQRRLDEVTIRNNILMNDLENSQATINILSRSRRGTITVPPLVAPPPPPIPRPRASASTNLNGGGENLGFVPQPPQQPTYRNLAYSQSPRDSRRKVPRRLVVHSNSSVESSSPTEDILQEARARLRRLEQETEAVDQTYRAFRQRHSQSLNENTRHLQRPYRSFSAEPRQEYSRAFEPRTRDIFSENPNQTNSVTNIGRRNQASDVYPSYENEVRHLTRNGNLFASSAFPFPSTSQSRVSKVPKYQSDVEDFEVRNDEPATSNFIPENVPSTSRGVTHIFHISDRPTQQNNEVENNVHDEFHDRASTGQSAASSGIIPPLHNLSLSSIEFSTDNADDSNKLPDKRDDQK